MTGLRSLVRSVRRDVHIHRSLGRTQRELSSAARGSKPILLGPWLSEIGFEVLYWIPMLNWFCETHGIERERVVAVSRGGADSWYRDVAGTYVDLFDHYSLDEVRELNEARVRAAGRQKQWRLTDSEDAILALARARAGIEDANVLHPSTMYWLFRWFWARKRPISLVEGHTVHRPLPDPGPPDGLDALPPDYVAVKAYFSSCFPDTEDNRAFLGELLGRLAAATHVVLLSTGLNMDDHSDYTGAANSRILSAEPMMTPRDNLQVQSAIIARSRALVTTYGGFSYLGPYLGVPSICFSSDQNFNPAHLDVMFRAARQLDARGGGAAFLPLNTRRLEPFDLISSLPTQHATPQGADPRVGRPLGAA